MPPAATPERGAGTPYVTVSLQRPGTYVVSTWDGVELGTVRGDYVIGFTGRYFGLVRRFADLNDATNTVVAEYLLQLSEPRPEVDPALGSQAGGASAGQGVDRAI